MFVGDPVALVVGKSNITQMINLKIKFRYSKYFVIHIKHYVRYPAVAAVLVANPI